MKIAQKQYELGFKLLGGSQRFDTTNYFTSIEASRNRPNPFTSPKQYIIKKNLQEPFKDYFVLKSNEKLRLKIETIQSKPVIPKLNVEYLELEQRIKNNKEKSRQIYNRALSLENEKFVHRVFTQKPRVIHMKFLEKLYEDNQQIKSPRRNVNGNTIYKKLKIKLPKISGYKDWRYSIHSRTEANLDENDESGNNNSLELKDHEHKEIKHQKQGHIEGQHRANNNDNNLETSN
jgi:hypothetical protein